jgi:two-component system, NarL family, sensor kinase
MKLRQKILMLAIVPLIVALSMIALAVRHQAILLGQQQRATIQAAYLASKETELKHYVALATHAIAPLVESGRSDDATLEQAKAILAKLDYGNDGYFFVYDLHGKNLMHPRQPELVGQNLWNLKDANGIPTIQRLTEQAQAGGGFVRYPWKKPSSHQVAPKLGYVVALPQWGWMLGTGIYLDDVDTALAKIDAQVSGNIDNTMLWISAIAILGALAVALAGWVLNFSEHRVADAKLKVLAQRVVRSQEEERARLSRDLHDGISQWLVSIKLQIEAGIIKLSGTPQQAAAALPHFERTAAQLNDVLAEVRRISHNLRPALLDDLGLAAALEHLTLEFCAGHATPIAFSVQGNTDGLSDVANTVLFRIAQEALTNIERHAKAQHITVRLDGNALYVRLTISDDGIGFDVEQIAGHPQRGIGLRNMTERLDAVNGQLQLASSDTGTTLQAIVQRH